jgi:hypothetical protein
MNDCMVLIQKNDSICGRLARLQITGGTFGPVWVCVEHYDEFMAWFEAGIVGRAPLGFKVDACTYWLPRRGAKSLRREV